MQRSKNNLSPEFFFIFLLQMYYNSYADAFIRNQGLFLFSSLLFF
jgi:hypothetical protein